METLKRTQLGKSYWDNNGAYQNEYEQLYKNLVKPSGSSDTLHGELIRAISRLQHEYCNNGNCNACETETVSESVTCSSCCGSGYSDNDESEECCECCGSGEVEEDVEGDSSVSKFYSKFLYLIESSIPSCSNEVSEVSEIICGNFYGNKEQFSETRMQKYSNLFDRVIHFVLTTENTEIPEFYTKD